MDTDRQDAVRETVQILRDVFLGGGANASPSTPRQRRQEALLRMLQTDQEPVQWVAIKELGQIGDERAADALLPFTSSPNRDVQEVAKDAYRRIQQRRQAAAAPPPPSSPPRSPQPQVPAPVVPPPPPPRPPAQAGVGPGPAGGAPVVQAPPAPPPPPKQDPAPVGALAMQRTGGLPSPAPLPEAVTAVPSMAPLSLGEPALPQMAPLPEKADAL